jgi:hypothetical protein
LSKIASAVKDEAARAAILGGNALRLISAIR